MATTTETDYASRARETLTKVLGELLQELQNLGARLASDGYKSEEGELADAARLCEVAQGVHAALRVRVLLGKPRSVETAEADGVEP